MSCRQMREGERSTGGAEAGMERGACTEEKQWQKRAGSGGEEEVVHSLALSLTHSVEAGQVRPGRDPQPPLS